MPKSYGCPIQIEMDGVIHLTDIVEQDHRTMKRRTRPMQGLAFFPPATDSVKGI